MHYKLIKETDPILFEKIVNDHIKDGWKLNGGTSITLSGMLLQGMVKTTGQRRYVLTNDSNAGHTLEEIIQHERDFPVREA